MHQFANVIESVLPKRASHAELRACPDIWVAKASDLADKTKGGQLRMPAHPRPAQRAVILVLESPHTKEFEGEPSPAKGTTGWSIANHLHSVPGLEKAANQPLILMNAVQYQCSLGEDTKLYRDAIFAEYWEQEGRAGFIQRLQALYQPGDTLVCACTRGYFKAPKEQLRQRVWEAMQGPAMGSEILRRNHPCTWNFTKNRQHEWTPA